MRLRLCTRIHYGAAHQGSCGNRRVVDYPVDDHVGRDVGDLDGIRRNFRDLPREVVFLGELFGRAVGAYEMRLHRSSSHVLRYLFARYAARSPRDRPSQLPICAITILQCCECCEWLLGRVNAIGTEEIR